MGIDNNGRQMFNFYVKRIVNGYILKVQKEYVTNQLYKVTAWEGHVLLYLGERDVNETSVLFRILWLSHAYFA